MYASSQASANAMNRMSTMYTHVGVQGAASSDTSGHELIAMLFDGLLGAIAAARGALRNADVPAKARAMGKALGIVSEGLRGSLNTSQGGDIAGNLDALYAYIELRLTHANLHNDVAALEECSELVRPLLEAWRQIAPQVRHAA